jgi:AraC-like DNA-binding protein
VTSGPATPQHLRDLARLRRVRDRIDREHARPLNVEALARDAYMSAGHLSRQFRLAYGESPNTAGCTGSRSAPPASPARRSSFIHRVPTPASPTTSAARSPR